ncbi:MAG: hypothetical protein HKN07_10470 [Acidimicrobiia bacterium]|nr:hypothetical protein [Acidimicrobiia bacterium]
MTTSSVAALGGDDTTGLGLAAGAVFLSLVGLVAVVAVIRWRFVAARGHVSGVAMPTSAEVKHGFRYPDDAD